MIERTTSWKESLYSYKLSFSRSMDFWEGAPLFTTLNVNSSSTPPIIIICVFQRVSQIIFHLAHRVRDTNIILLHEKKLMKKMTLCEWHWWCWRMRNLKNQFCFIINYGWCNKYDVIAAGLYLWALAEDHDCSRSWWTSASLPLE